MTIIMVIGARASARGACSAQPRFRVGWGLPRRLQVDSEAPAVVSVLAQPDSSRRLLPRVRVPSNRDLT
jgi:hypothetical protein